MASLADFSPLGHTPTDWLQTIYNLSCNEEIGNLIDLQDDRIKIKLLDESSIVSLDNIISLSEEILSKLSTDEKNKLSIYLNKLQNKISIYLKNEDSNIDENIKKQFNSFKLALTKNFSTDAPSTYDDRSNELISPEMTAKSAKVPKINIDVAKLIEHMKHTDDPRSIKNEMDNLLKNSQDLVKTNVIIMNALKTIYETDKTKFWRLNKIVLEKKIEWLNQLWPNLSFSDEKKQFEDCPDSICNIYYNNEDVIQPQPDKKVLIHKSTVTLSDLRNCSMGSHPLQELSGTCGIISLAQALARDDLSPTDFIKLMVCLNHYADLGDDEYLPYTLDESARLHSRIAMPGNKDLREIITGIRIMQEEEMESVHEYIRKDIALAIATNYSHETKEGKASIMLSLSQKDSEKHTCITLKEEQRLSNLQLFPGIDSIANIGIDEREWSEFEERVENTTKTICLVVPAVEGHYVAVKQDTEFANIEAWESADEISTGLKSLEFIPIEFSCHGAPMNNIILFNSLLRSIDSFTEINNFFKGVSKVFSVFNKNIDVIDYFNSSIVLYKNYAGQPMDENPTKQLIQATKKFNTILQNIDITEIESRKLNMLIKLHISNANPSTEEFFELINSLMKFNVELIENPENYPEEYTKLKELYNNFDLKQIETSIK